MPKANRKQHSLDTSGTSKAGSRFKTSTSAAHRERSGVWKSLGATGQLSIWMAGVCLAVAATHWPALSAKALSFDDHQYLLENPLVRNPSWAGVGRTFREVTSPSTVRGYYQPLAMVSLMADCAMGGRIGYLAPFHRTSLILHLANVALIIVFLHLLFGKPWAAGIAGLLFGVHPLTVEPIPWVGERKTLLAAFFALLCIIAYVRYVHCLRAAVHDSNPQSAIRNPQSKVWYGLCVVCYVLALLAKPTSTPLPVLMLLLDYWPLRRLGKRAILEKVPFFAIAALSAGITVLSQGKTAMIEMPYEYPAGRIPLILAHNIVFYLWKILWPANLTSHYPFPQPLSLAHPMILIGVVGTCVLIGVLLFSLLWTRALVTGWLFFFLAILPTMGIIGFTVVIASDKYAYLPFVGLLLPLTALLIRLRSTATKWGAHAAMVIVLAGATVAEAAATRHYLGFWHDTIALHEHMLKLAPQSAQLHVGLGIALLDANRIDEAIPYFQRGIELAPRSFQPYINLGNALAARERFTEAEQQYRLAIGVDPREPVAHNNLANVLLEQDKIDAAIPEYQEAIRLKYEYFNAHSNLAYALSQRGRTDEAITHYRTALGIDPSSFIVHARFAELLVKAGRVDEAVGHYRQALRLKPDYEEARNGLDAALAAPSRVGTAPS